MVKEGKKNSEQERDILFHSTKRRKRKARDEDDSEKINVNYSNVDELVNLEGGQGVKSKPYRHMLLGLREGEVSKWDLLGNKEGGEDGEDMQTGESEQNRASEDDESEDEGFRF